MIRAFMRRAKRVFWLLPGFLLWASFPPMGETSDCLFALAPLLWLSRNATRRESVRRWFLNGCVFWVATLAWMPAIVKNGGPWPLVVLGWAGLAAYCAAFFAAFGYLASTYWTWAKERRYGWRLAGLLVVEPVLWAGLEIVRSRFLGGFAWNQLGVAVVNGGFGTPAALGGVYLLSALVILINGTFASVVERIRAGRFLAPREKALRSIETMLPVAAVLGVYLLANAVVAARPAGDRAVKVAMIQRNFPCCFQTREEDPVAVYTNLLRNVTLLAPDLVVLPESAMAEVGAIDGRRAQAFARYIVGDRCAVLAGGGREAEGRLYNSAALYAGERVEVYDKVHLVPFGEFIPLDDIIPALKKLAPVGSCTAGELKTLDFDGLPLGVAICYEDTDSAQMRRLAEKGARLLVFITNDSWFSHSQETVQHAWHAVARAIETGLPVVRTGNSGVTGTILPDGRVSWLADARGKPIVDARGTLFDRLAVSSAPSAPTPYVRFGDTPLFTLFILLLAGLGALKFTPLRASRPF